MKFNIENKTLSIYKYWYARFKQYKDPEVFISFCKDKYSISTQRIIVSAIKYFSNEKIARTIKFPKGQSAWREISISYEEYNKIQNNLIYDDQYISIRNKTVIKVLWYTGLRINELLNLKWSDIVNGFIVVVGKGNKKRIIPIEENLIQFKNDSEFIFSTKQNKKISYSTIVKIFMRVKIILNRKDVSPHAFRHSFATRLLKKEVPIHYISKLLGHSSLSITERYLQWNIAEIKEILKEKDWLC